MTIFEKIDTNRHRRDINLCKPVIWPSAAEVSPDEPASSKSKPQTFPNRSTTESAIPASSVTPISTPETRAVPNHTKG